MVGVRALLAALELRHILAMRTIVRVVARVHPELAAWIDHAITWEESRRKGAAAVLLNPVPLMGLERARLASDVLRCLKGRLIDSVQVRLLVAAICAEIDDSVALDQRARSVSKSRPE